MISNPYGTVHQITIAEKELCMPHFLANPLVFYIVDGLKGDLINCFNILVLLYRDHVNIQAALK